MSSQEQQFAGLTRALGNIRATIEMANKHDFSGYDLKTAAQVFIDLAMLERVITQLQAAKAELPIPK